MMSCLKKRRGILKVYNHIFILGDIMNKVWLWVFFIALIYGIITGRGSDLSNALLNVPKETVSLLITLVGSACFWSGIVKIMEEAGIVKWICKRIKPLFKLIMPNFKDEEALEYMSMNISANILGLGYGATPSGLKAIKRMQELNNKKEIASNEMITFLVLNTAGVTVIPTTVIAIRSELGSSNPLDMLLLPLIATFISCVVGLLFDAYYRKKSHDN